MLEEPIQIVEVRAASPGLPVTITAELSGAASRAMFVALSEQLHRRRTLPVTSADDVLELREQTALVERFEPLAAAGAHAIVRLTESELRSCLLALTDYVDRVDGDHFQPPDLRERLQLIGAITPVLWDANSEAATAAEAAPAGAAR